jgi:hypothetical protein
MRSRKAYRLVARTPEDRSGLRTSRLLPPLGDRHVTGLSTLYWWGGPAGAAGPQRAFQLTELPDLPIVSCCAGCATLLQAVSSSDEL